MRALFLSICAGGDGQTALSLIDLQLQLLIIFYLPPYNIYYEALLQHLISCPSGKYCFYCGSGMGMGRYLCSRRCLTYLVSDIKLLNTSYVSLSERIIHLCLYTNSIPPSILIKSYTNMICTHFLLQYSHSQ